MSYLVNSVFYDLVYLVICILLIRVYFIQKIICSEKEQYFVLHVSPFLYIPLVCIHIIAMLYIIGVNRGFFFGEYTKEANIIVIMAVLIEFMISIYNRMKYGPKNQKFKNDTETGCISIILIIAILAVVCFFN